jgi:LuxR family transcriptional regulator, maltose regulon positive regulatory protein
MPSHPRSGSARTPRHGVSRRSDLRKRGQPSPTSLTPNEAQERGAAWRPDSGYQGDFLLATKYTIPPQHADTIGRPRLLDQLDQGLARKLTLVIAPAGYGKTSLLSSWAASLKAKDLMLEAHRARPVLANDAETTAVQASDPKPQAPKVAWLTLDATDDDLKRFWLYLTAALDALRPGLGVHALELLSGTPSAPIEAVLTMLLNAIADRPERLIIVLDNYHTITTPAIHQALSFLVEYLPPQLHLVLAGRTTPPLRIPT